MHSFLWCVLLTQVGQVILTYPYQMALMGVLPAVAVALGVGILNYYTLWLLIVLYLERKRIMVPPKHPHSCCAGHNQSAADRLQLLVELNSVAQWLWKHGRCLNVCRSCVASIRSGAVCRGKGWILL